MTLEEDILNHLEYSPTTGLLSWRVPKRRGTKPGDVAGHINKRGYWKIRIAGKSLFSHRVIWFMHYGSWPELDIDHKDGNTLNNRINNLRDVTHAQNMQNMAPRKGCTSKHKGVFWHKSSRKWRAVVTVNLKKIHLGLFDAEDEAASVYNFFALSAWGQHARLNYV